MRAFPAVLATALLVACQTPEPRPVVGSVTLPEGVTKTVVQPCVDPAKIPALPKTSLPKNPAPIDNKGEGAYADAAELWRIVKEQNRMLRACATVTTDKGTPP